MEGLKLLDSMSLELLKNLDFFILQNPVEKSESTNAGSESYVRRFAAAGLNLVAENPIYFGKMGK